MKLSPGDITDYTMIRKDINELADLYGIKELAIDRAWQGDHLAVELAADAISMVPFQQTFLGMGCAAAQFERMILSGDLRHGGDPILSWMKRNTTIEVDANGNIKPSKSRSADKIDGVIACVMAVGVAALNLPKKSVYDTRGLIEIGPRRNG